MGKQFSQNQGQGYLVEYIAKTLLEYWQYLDRGWQANIIAVFIIVTVAIGISIPW